MNLHPIYSSVAHDYTRWREVYDGGRPFVTKYLKRFPREGVREYELRKEITPSPSPAKTAINEVAGALFQRLGCVERRGGSQSYLDACQGLNGGVDKRRASMSAFMWRVIVELVLQGRVGVWVDNARLLSKPTLQQVQYVHPYLYMYRAEDIQNWSFDDAGELMSVLLQRSTYAVNEFGFPESRVDKSLTATKTDNGIKVVIGEDAPAFLELAEIPFVVAELPQSLMKDIDGHQIAILNMLSADVSYCTKHNYPFYVEQYDHRVASQYTRPAQPKTNRVPSTSTQPAGSTESNGEWLTPAGQAAQAGEGKALEIRTGTGSARRVPMGTEMPRFIHPSAEPLLASMQMREQLKREIREQVMLVVSSMDPKQASAESKSADWRSLENGLAFIGLILEQLERGIAERWADYERAEPTSIEYPEMWSYLTEADRRIEAEDLKTQLTAVNSPTYRKEIAKQIVKLLIGHKVPLKVLDVILAEVESAIGTTTDWETIIQDVNAGLLSHETGSEMRGYPKIEAVKAKAEHVERLTLIASMQGAGPGDAGARGVHDLGADPNAGKKERAQDAQKRGAGQKPNDQKGPQ